LKDLARLALDTASARGADYADVRAIEFTSEDIQVKNGDVGGLDLSESTGLGVRVLVGGAWGFAATDELTKQGVENCAAQAVSIGRASAGLRHENVRLATEPAHCSTWATQCAVDPFKVPLERKLDLLFRMDAEIRTVKNVKNAESFLSFQRKHQFFMSTEG
jgi:TldD protein